MNDPNEPRRQTECTHGMEFDQETAKHLSARVIRERYPRLNGPCPLGCGFEGIAYKSFLHYMAGDW